MRYVDVGNKTISDKQLAHFSAIPNWRDGSWHSLDLTIKGAFIGV